MHSAAEIDDGQPALAGRDRVVLSESELIVCRTVAIMRHLANRGGGVRDRQRAHQDKWQIDVDGMVAEYAFAKLANLCPDLTVYQRSGGADLTTYKGKTVDVKSTRVPNGKLLGEPKKKDQPSDVYVLMIVDDVSAAFAGWAYGYELFDDSRLTDLGHGPTYAMAQDQLRQSRVYARAAGVQ